MPDFAGMDGCLTWAEIDLDAIEFNIHAIKQHIGPEVGLITVVKANGYGHGAVQVARASLNAGAARLAVHRIQEGVELRKAGIHAPILIFGYIPTHGASLVANWALTASPTCLPEANALSAAALNGGRKLPIHIKVDTGINRNGLYPGEVIPFLEQVSKLPGLYIEGMYSHFATADEEDQTVMRQQLRIFEAVLANAKQAGYTFDCVHMANSAATMIFPESHFNSVRPGVSIYGLLPSSQWTPPFAIRPALSLKSHVVRLHDLPTGEGISYGHTFITQRPTRAALVPVGYGDGYHRAITQHGSVLIRGQRAAILGRICMDQIVVDVTDIPSAALGDEVVLIGRQGSESILAEEVAKWAGTINYEVTTSLLPRAVRTYYQNGQLVEVVSPN